MKNSALDARKVHKEGHLKNIYNLFFSALSVTSRAENKFTSRKNDYSPTTAEQFCLPSPSIKVTYDDYVSADSKNPAGFIGFNKQEDSDSTNDLANNYGRKVMLNLSLP